MTWQPLPGCCTVDGECTCDGKPKRGDSDAMRHWAADDMRAMIHVDLKDTDLADLACRAQYATAVTA